MKQTHRNTLRCIYNKRGNVHILKLIYIKRKQKILIYIESMRKYKNMNKNNKGCFIKHKTVK